MPLFINSAPIKNQDGFFLYSPAQSLKKALTFHCCSHKIMVLKRRSTLLIDGGAIGLLHLHDEMPPHNWGVVSSLFYSLDAIER